MIKMTWNLSGSHFLTLYMVSWETDRLNCIGIKNKIDAGDPAFRRDSQTLQRSMDSTQVSKRGVLRMADSLPNPFLITKPAKMLDMIFISF